MTNKISLIISVWAREGGIQSYLVIPRLDRGIQRFFLYSLDLDPPVKPGDDVIITFTTF
jgi:hypothetical protein